MGCLERFLTEYDLSTEEGVLLMCLAETLLRIPDADTADLLIADKIRDADWEEHLGSRDLLVNASTWGLMLTGHLLPAFAPGNSPRKLWRDVMTRTSGPVIRNAILLAMRIIGDQFVLGETIKQALSRAGKSPRPWEAFSFAQFRVERTRVFARYLPDDRGTRWREAGSSVARSVLVRR